MLRYSFSVTNFLISAERMQTAHTSITYTLRLSRLDKKMITLLIGEASAGALSRALVTTSGSASSGRIVSPETLKRAEERVKDAANAVTTANKNLAVAMEEKAKQSDVQKQKEADAKIVEAKELLRAKLEDLSDSMLEKWALQTQGSGLLTPTTASAIVGSTAIRDQRSPCQRFRRRSNVVFWKDDDLGTLIDACLTST